MQIKLLDSSTISQIAAGEVVERPASVAKELAENSLDAGARHISIELKQGGTELLRVVDDGCGIPPEQVRLAFENHATSKLRAIDDITDVTTMGFRGEALPSIAAVSKMEMCTRTADMPSGMKITVEGGRINSIGEVGCSEGTSVTMRDIFYNIPARREFLKKPQAESAAIVDLSTKLALANPGVAFKIASNGKTLLRTPGDGQLRHAVMAVYDRKTALLMKELDSEEGGMHISGLIGVGECAKSSRSHQNFFVNGRCIRSALLSQALETACRSRVMIGRFPMCALNITLPGKMVDVNVHPSKLEVRFKDEAYIFSAASVIMERAFASENMLTPQPALDDTPAPLPPIRLFTPGADTAPGESAESTADNAATAHTMPDGAGAIRAIGDAAATASAELAPARIHDAEHMPGTETDTSARARSHSELMSAITSAYNRTAPDKPSAAAPCSGASAASNPNSAVKIFPIPDRAAGQSDAGAQRALWHGEAEKLRRRRIDDQPEASAQAQLEFPSHGTEMRLIGSAFDTYIFAQCGDSLYVIDQHAAHERILYERFMKQWGSGVISQPMLVPSIVSVSQSEKQQILDNLELLNSIGFDVDEFGAGDIQVRAVPQVMGEPDMRPFFLSSLQELRRLKAAPLEQRRDAVIQAACKHAVKGGDALNRAEIEALLTQMRTTGAPPTCPHGRPVIIELPRAELERRFGRTV